MFKVNTDDIIADIQSGDADAMCKHSRYAACLLPLISVLETQITPRDIAEALPHYSFNFDLDALRSILAQLGYRTEKHVVNVEDIEAKLTPCLFIDSKDKLRILYQKTNNKYVHYVADENVTGFDDLSGRGEAYFLTYVNDDKPESNVKRSWFLSLVERFKPLFKTMLAVSLVLNLTTLCVPLFIMVVYDQVIGQQNLAALPVFLTGITLVLGVDLLLRLIRAKVLAIPAGRLEYLLSTESLKQILSLPSSLTERTPVTVQLSRLRLFDSVRDFFTGPSALLVLELPFVPIFLCVIGILGGILVAVPLGVLLAFLIIGLFILPRLKASIADAAEAKTEREQLLLETLSGTLEVKVMGEEDGWLQRLRETSARAVQATLHSSQIQLIASNVTQGIMMLAAVLVMSIGGYQAIAGELTVGALIAIMAILWRVLSPLQGVFLAYVQFDQIIRGIKGLDDLMRLKRERKASKSSLLKKSYSGDIKFERVSFRYSNNLDPVLIGANIHIKENEFAVLVGDNGCGKSTILKLLCGMYYAQMGNIYVDDTEIRQLNVIDLRRVIGYVPQHPRLFHGDIAHNLRLCDLLISDEELHAAAEEAGILDDIIVLPEGFNTRIGEKGSDGLPSGLHRGLCIARAFVRKSPILILDEPGTSQDKENLRHLSNQLAAIKGKKTILTVSHIPQIIRLADKVIEMERGLIKQIVTPQVYFEEKAREGLV